MTDNDLASVYSFNCIHLTNNNFCPLNVGTFNNYWIRKTISRAAKEFFFLFQEREISYPICKNNNENLH